MWTNLIKHRPAARATMDLKFRAVFSHRSATRLKSLEPPDALLDACAGFVEGAGEESWLVLFVGLVGNNGSDAARSRGVPIGLAGVAFVAETARG